MYTVCCCLTSEVAFKDLLLWGCKFKTFLGIHLINGCLKEISSVYSSLWYLFSAQCVFYDTLLNCCLFKPPEKSRMINV
jgi:hypothetical protein